MLGRLDKRIVDQASDVPSIIFFRLFIDLGHSKLFTFIFVFFKKNKQIDWKYFCKEFCKKSWKKIILGTSDAWSTIHLSHRPSDRAWIYLRLTNFWTLPQYPRDNHLHIYHTTNDSWLCVTQANFRFTRPLGSLHRIGWQQTCRPLRLLCDTTITYVV